jgi:hypothetical protein
VPCYCSTQTGRETRDWYGIYSIYVTFTWYHSPHTILSTSAPCAVADRSPACAVPHQAAVDWIDGALSPPHARLHLSPTRSPSRSRRAPWPEMMTPRLRALPKPLAGTRSPSTNTRPNGRSRSALGAGHRRPQCQGVDPGHPGLGR